MNGRERDASVDLDVMHAGLSPGSCDCYRCSTLMVNNVELQLLGFKSPSIGDIGPLLVPINPELIIPSRSFNIHVMS